MGISGAAVLACTAMMLVLGGSPSAWAAGKGGGRKAPPAPAAKAAPVEKDTLDDDLEGAPRHAVQADDSIMILVDDDYALVGQSLRFTLSALIAPHGNSKALILVEQTEIDCKGLRLRTINSHAYRVDMSSNSFNAKMSEWAPLMPGDALLNFAQVACKGGRLTRGHVPTAPLDELYAMTFDAPTPRYLQAWGEGGAMVMEVRRTGSGLRPQVVQTLVLREPDHDAAYFTYISEIDCEQDRYRSHRLTMRREDGSVIGTAGAEKAWQKNEEGLSRIAADAVCKGVFPQEEPMEVTLAEVRQAVLAKK